jgi:hypothetical protein
MRKCIYLNKLDAESDVFNWFLMNDYFKGILKNFY